jgi:hypothetical protein
VHPIVSSFERDGSEEQWCSSKPILCDPERIIRSRSL